MEEIAGCRALWQLYKRGRWGYLLDFGLDREEAESAFAAFERYEIVGNRLTKAQCRRLMDMVPGLKEASIEMRLAYILKNLDERTTHEDLSSASKGRGSEHTSRAEAGGTTRV